jgi:hypothetical protein
MLREALRAEYLEKSRELRERQEAALSPLRVRLGRGRGATGGGGGGGADYQGNAMTNSETLNLDYRQATLRAYERLSIGSKYLLDRNVAALCSEFKGCGEPTALEILAAVGRLMARDEERW